MSPDAPTPGAPKPDPRDEAERRLRVVLAREARETRDALNKIKYAGYGCLALVVLALIIAIFVL